MTTDNTGRFQTGQDATTRGAQGMIRMKQIAAEMAKAVEANSEIMCRGFAAQFGREPNPIERYQAQEICSLHWRAAKARETGRSDLEFLKLAAELTNSGPFAWTTHWALQRPAGDKSNG
jgi:hypothetical protein